MIPSAWNSTTGVALIGQYKVYIRVKLKIIMILNCWRGKIQTGENHVRQGLLKVFAFLTYSTYPFEETSFMNDP